MQNVVTQLMSHGELITARTRPSRQDNTEVSRGVHDDVAAIWTFSRVLVYDDPTKTRDRTLYWLPGLVPNLGRILSGKCIDSRLGLTRGYI